MASAAPPTRDTREQKDTGEARGTGIDPVGMLVRDRTNPNFLVSHHLNSFNRFLKVDVTNTIRELNPITLFQYDEHGTSLYHKIEMWVGGADCRHIWYTPPGSYGKNGVLSPLMPQEARDKNYDYRTELRADVHMRVTDHDGRKATTVIEDTHVANLPVMVGSIMCREKERYSADVTSNMEPPGYFIIEGREKTVVSRENEARDTVFVEEVKDTGSPHSHAAWVRSLTASGYPKTLRLFVIRPPSTAPPAYGASTLPSMSTGPLPFDPAAPLPRDRLERVARGRGGAITLRLPFADPKLEAVELPLFVVFRALGVTSDRDILRLITQVDDIDDHAAAQEVAPLLAALRPSVVDGSILYTQSDALDYITARSRFPDDPSIVLHGLRMELLPPRWSRRVQVEVGAYDLESRAIALGDVVRQLVATVSGVRLPRSRDSWLNKRVDASGRMLSDLFKESYTTFKNNAKNKLNQEYARFIGRMGRSDAKSVPATDVVRGLLHAGNTRVVLDPAVVSDRVRAAFKGDWPHAQELERLSLVGTLSHMRRTMISLDPTSKTPDPRRLKTCTWGVLCPMESPDGGEIGILRNLAIGAHVTHDVPVEGICAVLLALGVTVCRSGSSPSIAAQMSRAPGTVRVYVNDSLFGVADGGPRGDAAAALVRRLKVLKRSARINVLTSIAWDRLARELRVNTDGGRILRPLWAVPPGHRSRTSMVAAATSWVSLVAPYPGSGGWDDGEVYVDDAALAAGGAAFSTWVDGLTTEGGGGAAGVSPIELLDPREGDCELIGAADGGATAATYWEIDGILNQGVVSSCIPFSNHNQAPRVAFCCAQMKQAVGVYSPTITQRLDAECYMLHSPQLPMSTTRVMDELGLGRLPAGTNAVVAIACYSGYNQEDSVILNRRSVEAGLFHMTLSKSKTTKEERSGETEAVVFGNPLTVISDRNIPFDRESLESANYSTLDPDGRPIVGRYVREGDALVGKIRLKLHANGNASGIDLTTRGAGASDASAAAIAEARSECTVANKTVWGFVDRVGDATLEPRTGFKYKFRVHRVMLPAMGDKMASRHGQKGVVGRIMDPEDMPVTDLTGMCPDIIINPHALPTRMTVGHLMETLLNKSMAMSTTSRGARVVDGSVSGDMRDAASDLEAVGLRRTGDEAMRCGTTGHRMDAAVFMGPVYYMRLKHMVSEKLNYRCGGKVDRVTRQPPKGRVHDGGLRIGEMERDALAAHGISTFLKETYTTRSDAYAMPVDGVDGLVGVASRDGRTTRDDGASTCRVIVPYPMKQLLNEVVPLGVALRLDVSEAGGAPDTGDDDDVIIDDGDDDVEDA